MAAVKGTGFYRIIGFTALIVITHMARWAGITPGGNGGRRTAIIPARCSAIYLAPRPLPPSQGVVVSLIPVVLIHAIGSFGMGLGSQIL